MSRPSTLALKVDVCTHDGMRDGVPRLLALLAEHRVKASFFLSFGPDNAGKAVAHLFRPGFLKKMVRSSAPSMYGLRTMLAAVEGAPDWALDVVGPVAAGDADWLTDWRRTSPARDRVRLHGRLAPEQAWAFAAGAWVGLALLEDTPAFADALPTKVYEYLACGLAVLTTPVRRTAQLVRSSGAGEVVADGQAAAQVLDRWAQDHADLGRCRAAARAWADEQLHGRSPYDELADVVAGLLPGA
jgi:glycosyltransferase involved in cell wall biosynthesis